MVHFFADFFLAWSPTSSSTSASGGGGGENRSRASSESGIGLCKIRMRRAANQQRRRAEMMPGGVVVELEIAMPQFRYVAQFSKWFDAARPQCP
jgi:hypothetical protein